MKLLTHAALLISLTLLAAPGTASAADVARFDDAVGAVAASARPLATAVDHGLAVRDERVQVVAVTELVDTSGLERWLEDRGATFVVSFHGQVQAFVPAGLLSDLGSHPDVRVVERPLYAELPGPAPAAAARKTTTLAVTSEGLAAMAADAWHAAGVTGSGITVGVIDIEFGGWTSLLGVELPPADRTTYRAFGGAQVVADQVHGSGCAEIIHDLAPDAELLLAHIRTGNDFFAALDWLAVQQVDVVSMSIGWYGAGPGDGTGPLADAITAFVGAADGLFITSAGNERRSHWQGPGADGDGNGWVEFAPGVERNELSSSMAAGDRVAVTMVWDDWTSPTQDYSLHLFNLDGAEPVEVAVSDRTQTGLPFQTPSEQISYTAPQGGRFAVGIYRKSVTGTDDVEVFSLDSDLVHRVANGSITIPTDSDDVFAAAAIATTSPYTIRSYSSAGPTNGPGGAISGGAVKPDISGYDGVSTVSYGTRSFFGTSAAAPHVAGAAALVRAADPGLDQAQTRAFLESRAFDLGPGGKDNDYGWGRLFLAEAPGSTCSFEVDPAGASLGPGSGGGLINVTTDPGCPWTTSSLVGWMAVAPAAANGSGIAGYTVEANPGASPRTGELIVADHTFVVTQQGLGVEISRMVAGIAEGAGAANTRWRSDLAVLNPTSAAADVELVYRHQAGATTRTMTIGPGEIVELTNVAVGTFGLPDSAGAVELASTTGLIVTARTYNNAAAGTFGQFIPGVTVDDGLAAGGEAALSQLNSGPGFRTNIGFVDLAGDGAVARIRLFDGGGNPVGAELREIIPPGGWFQRNRVFREAGAGDCSGCYALVDVVGADGVVWAYASVVDNDSGDPTTVPMVGLDAVKIALDRRFLVAGIAETGGANQTRWKSNLALLNLSGQGVSADLTYRFADGSSTTSVALADGELREFENVAAELFAAPNTAGAVDVGADAALVVTARTFNDAPAGTFGQFLPGLDAASALSTGDEGVLTQLKSTDDFRTNIGFVNFSDRSCQVRVQLYDDQGVRKGTFFSTAPAGGWVQENRVFETSGAGRCPLGYAVVEVMTATCEVWAYASVVDNISGDPTTVPVWVE